jgi:hypothetical protein
MQEHDIRKRVVALPQTSMCMDSSKFGFPSVIQVQSFISLWVTSVLLIVLFEFVKFSVHRCQGQKPFIIVQNL